MTANEARESLKKQSRGRLLAFKVLSLLFGVSLSLLVAEFAVRILAPQALISDIVTADDDIDYRLRPNARGRMTSPEYSVSIRINSLGFRGDEFSLAKTPGRMRVLFLGDSYTFGHGLGEEETLPYVVGQQLERTHPGRYEVINGGVYGYCTANELEYFMKYGLPLKPDIVVILVMIHDMFDNPSWYEVNSDGSLRRRTIASQYVASRRITRHIPGAAWLRENSHLFKFVGVRVLPVLRSGVGPPSKNVSQGGTQEAKIDEFSPAFYEQKGGPFEVTTALMAKFADVSKESRAQLLLLTLGGERESLAGKVTSDLSLPHQQLIKAALRAGFSEALALSPILATARNGDVLFFPKDGHWTGVATRLVAPTVADVITRVTDTKERRR
jgi:hypothetical protein